VVAGVVAALVVASGLQATRPQLIADAATPTPPMMAGVTASIR